MQEDAFERGRRRLGIGDRGDCRCAKANNSPKKPSMAPVTEVTITWASVPNEVVDEMSRGIVLFKVTLVPPR